MRPEPYPVSTAGFGWLARSTATPARVGVWLGALVAAAAGVHVLLVTGYHGPWVFDDELGYQKLAQSLGTAGRLELFGKQGLSYSPLYPLVIAPLDALHLSGPDVYHWAKIVNCGLMALALVPVYKIARFVLSPGRAVLAAGLSALAPLMLYSSLEMSESLAYPLCLLAFWAMLVAVRSPSVRNDVLVLVTCLLATAARLQFAVLVPAAFAFIVVETLVGQRGLGTVGRRLRRAVRAHLVLTVATTALVVVAAGAMAGTSLTSIAGRYANQATLPAPSAWRIVELLVQHVAGLVFAVEVLPFAGALVAAYVWVRRGASRTTGMFAVMSITVTVFLLVLTAFASYGQSYAPGARDLPRIHERYLFYVVPLFLIAMLATTAIPRSTVMLRIGLVAGVLTGVLSLVIPYGSVMNDTVAVDTFGLSPFAGGAPHGGIQALAHATILGFGYALCLALVYVLARPNLGLVVAMVAVAFVWVSVTEHRLLDIGARSATGHSLPGRRDWVDAAAPTGKVILVEAPLNGRDRQLGIKETAFFNLSVSRLYYPCRPLLSSDFGEQQVAVDGLGRLRSVAGPIRARYAVVPADSGIQGRVIAVDPPGHLVLVRPTGGVLLVAPSRRRWWDHCSGSRLRT